MLMAIHVSPQAAFFQVMLTYPVHPLSCHDAYCGYNYIYNAVGCCGTYSGANSTYTLGGCNYQLACIAGYDVAGNCDESCLTESMILKWWVFSTPFLLQRGGGLI